MKRILNRLISDSFVGHVCALCGRPFELGDDVAHQPHGPGHRLVHAECMKIDEGAKPPAPDRGPTRGQ